MKPDELLGLYSEAFKSIVNNDIRGECDDETAAALRHPTVSRRWYNTLVATKRSIETQFATFKIEKVQKLAEAQRKEDNRAYIAYMEEKNKWRTGALRFKSSVEEKIAEAKSYLRETDTIHYELIEAIRDHQVRCMADPDRAEDWDEELWRRLK